jgi:hypothetical protein
MAHPTPEEERATIHGPGFALTIAQQRVVGRAVSLVPVMAKLISCKSRFRDRCYRGRLAVSVRVCGSPDRLEGGRGHAGNVSCFIVERLFERFCTGNRMQSNAKCLSATEIRLNRAWCRDSNFPLCSWIRGAMRSASSPCAPWLRNPRGGAVCNLQGVQACFSFSFFFFFDEEAHRRSAEGGRRRSPTSLWGYKKPRTDKHPSDDLSSWNFSTGNDRKTWGRWIADEPPAGIRGASFTDMRR